MFEGLATNARTLRSGIVTASTAIVVTFCVLTWRQQALYRDVETLWRLTLKKDPKCWLAHNNLGVRYLNRSMHDEALRHLHKTIELKHDHCAAHTNVGIVMMARNQYDEAYRFMSRAVELCPDWPTGLGNLASLLIKLKRYDAASQHLIESMEKDPGRASAHYDLGVVFYVQEAFAKAIFHFEKVIASQPRNAEAIYALGMAHMKAGRFTEGQPYLENAMTLAEQQGNTELAARIEADRRRYRERMPPENASGVAR
jgi:tetratricopeptide (TPR) repeat protein